MRRDPHWWKIQVLTLCIPKMMNATNASERWGRHHGQVAGGCGEGPPIDLMAFVISSPSKGDCTWLLPPVCAHVQPRGMHSGHVYTHMMGMNCSKLNMESQMDMWRVGRYDVDEGWQCLKHVKMRYVVQSGMNVSACCTCIEALWLCTFEEELGDPTHKHEVPNVLSPEEECSRRYEGCGCTMRTGAHTGARSELFAQNTKGGSRRTWTVGCRESCAGRR